jgi:valyl-tRNA synthetase
VGEKEKRLAATRSKLANEGFVSRAPADVVRQQRELAADLEAQIQTLHGNIASLTQSPDTST